MADPVTITSANIEDYIDDYVTNTTLNTMGHTPVAPTTGNTHYVFDGTNYQDGQSNRENWQKLMEPGLRRIFFETYAEVPEQYSKIYNVKTSTKQREHEFGLGAFGDWTQRTGEFDTVSYQTMSTGLAREYVHKSFTSGFMIGRELYDDEQYGQIKKFPAALARSGRAFVEKEAAKLLTYAFNDTQGNGQIYDGEALCDTAHPLVDSNKTCSNKGTAAFSGDALKAAIKAMKNQLDEAGNLMVVSPKKLVIPPALEWKAREVLNSTLLADTANNNINSLHGALDIIVYDYLGSISSGVDGATGSSGSYTKTHNSDNFWFLIDPTLCELNFYWRTKPEFKGEDDFDTFVAKYRGYMRFSYGVSDWRGVWGSTGAGE